MKRVLSVQDLSCVGKCSLTVAMPVLSAMGCQCTPLPTGVLSSHTAFPNPHIRPLTEDIVPICRHFQEIGAEFDAISVGYLANPAQASSVEQVLDAFDALTVLDPVLGDHGKLYRGIDESYVNAMRQLCKKADILLPNVTEAAFLSGIPYRQTTDAGYYRDLLEGMKALGSQGVVLTGVSLAADTVGFFSWDKGQEFSYQAQRQPNSSHGTGDLFTAVFTGAKANQATTPAAAELAAKFVARVLCATKEATPFGVCFETELPWLWQQQEKNS